ncbi:glycosyltransferase family 2 protein [Methanobrevibacter sp.]|uniref:glycosyltransferase family 2 protein n=1 Tax=Methanobrevibacter sp. TaxID=66852 RepID=UPI00386E3EEC
MIQPKISVIIPVYNTGDYLEETLMSLLNQTMIDDIEVLMIDDGSSDDSRYIIEKYALDYDNFHAYHKENEGQGVARNYAMQFAKGEYIHFFDSDDYLPPNAYETLYGHALKNNDDMIIFNVSYFSFYNNWENILFKNSYNKLSENIYSTSLADYLDMLWDTITCNKLYKKEFLEKNDIRFLDKKIFFEDIPFSLETYLLADSITVINEKLYFWRYRNNKSSTTQHDLSVRNFKDRLDILEVCLNLFDNYHVGEDIRNFEYIKWLNHDLKFFLKRIDNYPNEYYEELLDEVYDIIRRIPSNLFDDLTSYQQVLYNLILDKRYDEVIEFAPLENELYENPAIPQFLDDKYRKYFDFIRDAKSQDLNVEVVNVSNDESNLFLEFEGHIYFLPSQTEHDVVAELVDGNDIYGVEVNKSDNIITIPFERIKHSNDVKVKITYKFDDFTKEAYLKIKKRKLVSFDDFDVEINFRKSFHVYLDYKEKHDNKIEVTDISFNSKEFVFKATSQNRINRMILENNITFEKFSYPVDYIDESTFEFIIPYDDILSSVIKKWELNCEDSLNNVFLSKKYHFFTKNYEIKFSNVKNKIYISNQIYDPIESLKQLNDKNDKLNMEKKKLKKENSSLKKDIEKYNSQKVVKLIDKFKL